MHETALLDVFKAYCKPCKLCYDLECCSLTAISINQSINSFYCVAKSKIK